MAHRLTRRNQVALSAVVVFTLFLVVPIAVEALSAVFQACGGYLSAVERALEAWAGGP